MKVGSHFVKFTVIKSNCQKQSGCVFASGKNAMYPYNYNNTLKGQYIYRKIKDVKDSWGGVSGPGSIPFLKRNQILSPKPLKNPHWHPQKNL